MFDVNRGKKDLIATKNSTTEIEILFKPSAMIDKPYNGKLIIKNPVTLDHSEYILLGIVEEPLAKDHIIIKC